MGWAGWCANETGCSSRQKKSHQPSLSFSVLPSLHPILILSIIFFFISCIFLLPSHPTLQTCRSPATRPVDKQLTHMQKRTQGEHKQCLYLLRGSSLKLSDNPIQTASILSKGVITAIFSPLLPCLSCYGGIFIAHNRCK